VTGPALIVVKIANGRAVEATNLNEIWRHLGNKPEFFKYVREQVAVQERNQAGPRPGTRPW
jgi:hypothetical protein